MNYYSAIFLAIAVLCTAQNTFAEDSLTLGRAVDQSEKSLNSVVDDSREAGDFLTARTAQELLFLLNAFEASNDKLLNDAFDAVSKERRQFIGAIESAVKDLNRGFVKTTDRSKKVVDHAYQLVKDVTLDAFPTVFRYRGSVIVPGDKAEVRLRVRGANLTYGEPYYELDGKSYPASRPTAQDLLVTIPRDVFVHDDKAIIIKNGTLHLSYESGGFLGFFTNEEAVVNEIGFIVLPKTLGHAKVQYEVVATERKEIVETGNWHDNAPSGCRSFSHASAEAEGERPGMTTRGADVYMVICVSRDVSDKTGEVEPYRYKIVEYRDEPTRAPTTKELKLGWRADSTVSIGHNVDKLLFTFTDFSGRETKHSPNSNPRAQYGQVSFDDQGVVLFRPIIPTYLTAL